MEGNLELENRVVVSMVEAAAGRITPTLHALCVLVPVVERHVQVFAAFTSEDALQRELLEEATSDLESFLDDLEMLVTLQIWVGPQPLNHWVEDPGRVVFSMYSELDRVVDEESAGEA